jgi:hypothetical protein
METINIVLDEDGDYSGNLEVEYNNLTYSFDISISTTWHHDSGTYWQPPESYVTSEDITVDNIEVTDENGDNVEFDYKEVEQMIIDAIEYE